MNLSELNKIEEGILGNIGTAIKDRFQQGGYQTKVQDIFIKDFVQDAITSLNNGIKGGLIDPNVKSNQTATPAEPAAKPGEQPYKWAPAGMNVTPDTKLSSLGATGDLAESKYRRLNQIFESIINVDEAAQLRTISDFMMDWFTQYMQGVNWNSNKPIVQQKLEKLQDEYPKNIKQNLTDLARIGLALSKAATPAGAPQEFTQAKKEQASSVQELKAALDELAQSNPAGYNELIKTLKPVTVT